jgi:hypothetical protein
MNEATLLKWIIAGLSSILSLVLGFTLKDLYRRIRVVEEFKDKIPLQILELAKSLEFSGKQLESLTHEVRLSSTLIMNHCTNSGKQEKEP